MRVIVATVLAALFSAQSISAFYCSAGVNNKANKKGNLLNEHRMSMGGMNRAASRLPGLIEMVKSSNAGLDTRFNKEIKDLMEEIGEEEKMGASQSQVCCKVCESVHMYVCMYEYVCKQVYTILCHVSTYHQRTIPYHMTIILTTPFLILTYTIPTPWYNT